MAMPEPTAPERLAEIRANDQFARRLRGDDLDDDHATDAEIDRSDLLAAFDALAAERDALKVELREWATRLANATGAVPAVDIAWKLRQIVGDLEADHV